MSVTVDKLIARSGRADRLIVYFDRPVEQGTGSVGDALDVDNYVVEDDLGRTIAVETVKTGGPRSVVLLLAQNHFAERSYTVAINAVKGLDDTTIAGNPQEINPPGFEIDVQMGTPALSEMSAYEAEVLADNPEIYYKLNESVGPTVTDYSGNGFDGTLAGNPTLEVAGPFPGSVGIQFDGIDDRLTPSSPYSPTFTDFTFECWFKVASGFDPTNGTFLSWQENGGAGGGIAVGIGNAPGGLMTTGKIWAGWTEPFVVEITGTNAATFNDGNWHHLVVVYDGTNGVEYDASMITIYIDGVAEAVTEASFANYADTAPHATNRAFFAGTDAASWDNFVACHLAHIAIYRDSNLSAGRVAAHYNAALP